MGIFRGYQLLCVGTLAVALLVALTGWAPGSAQREQLPQSVRDNPAAWRPVYVTGYHAVVTSGGGYSYGK